MCEPNTGADRLRFEARLGEIYLLPPYIRDLTVGANCVSLYVFGETLEDKPRPETADFIRFLFTPVPDVRVPVAVVWNRHIEFSVDAYTAQFLTLGEALTYVVRYEDMDNQAQIDNPISWLNRMHLSGKITDAYYTLFIQRLLAENTLTLHTLSAV